jgi:glycine/D-amino acid oxidase-like deaminating enzyme
MTAVDNKALAPSLWLEPAPEPGPSLAADIEVDVAVIGAGYTGLSAALALREKGASVAVLERDYAGFGASGRNAGHLTPTIGKDVPSMLKVFGQKRTRKLVALADRAVEHTEAKIAANGIDCDYLPSGNIAAGVHEGQRQMLEKAAAAAALAGAPIRPLSFAELRERELPLAFTSGYLEERGGVLNPGKYVRGLREAVLAAGAELYEGTRVLAIEEDAGRVRIETPRGRVHAGRCVLATNAFTHELGLLRSVAVPIHVSMFATEPLTAEQRSRIGWPNMEGVYTAHEVLESYRLSADGRLVGGSRFIRYAYNNRIPADHDAATFAKQEAMLRMRFPELSDVAIARRWAGPTAFTFDFLPTIGRTGPGDRVIYSIAYAGHGVAMASYCGDLVGRMAAGEQPGEHWRPLIKRLRPPIPPEPLRWAVVKAIIAGLEKVDERSDARAAAERPH